METCLMQERTLAFGDARIRYHVRYSRRRLKTITIQVRDDGRVLIAAPAGTGVALIDALVSRRAPWIQRQLLAHQSSVPVPRLRYVSGEQHWYQGHRYNLKIINDKNIKCDIKIHHDQLRITTRLENPDAVRRQILAWYRDCAGRLFTQRLDALLPGLPWKQADQPLLRLRFMQRRWGSCSGAGVITLNPHLVKAPDCCVDFVLAHELCHLRELNHGKRFYRLLDLAQPGWKDNRALLNAMAAVLMNA